MSGNFDIVTFSRENDISLSEFPCDYAVPQEGTSRVPTSQAFSVRNQEELVVRNTINRRRVRKHC